MHKYIKRQTKKLKLSQAQNSQQLESIPPLRQIRFMCQTGQTVSQQKIIKFLDQPTEISQKQSLINELLLCKKGKLIQKLMNQKKIDKALLIDSNDAIKALYESELKDISMKKLFSKPNNEIKEEAEQTLSKNLTKKQQLWKMVQKKLKIMKNLHPKYYVTVIGLIIVAILAKKYRQKIITMLKLIFNI